MEKETKNKKKKAIPFKDFLEKSVSLITIFGIFNALFIYSNTIENQGASDFLLPTFYLLSLVVWFEIIISAVDSSNGNWRYELFYFLSCSIFIGLTWYFMSIFSPLLITLLIYGSFLLLIYLIARTFVFFLPKLIKKTSPKVSQYVHFFSIFCAIIIAALIWKFGIVDTVSELLKKRRMS